MNASQANKLRLVAADIVHKLWRHGQTDQLLLLGAQVQASVDKPATPEAIQAISAQQVAAGRRPVDSMFDTTEPQPPEGARHDDAGT